jgi:hypothetical protein
MAAFRRLTLLAARGIPALSDARSERLPRRLMRLDLQ